MVRKTKKSKEKFENTSSASGNISWWGLCSVCCCIIVIILIYFAIRLWWQEDRYEVAKQALDSGRTDVAMAAMAPEIGQAGKAIGSGLGSVFKGIGSGIGSIMKSLD